MNKLELGWFEDKAVIRIVGKGCVLNSRSFKEALARLADDNYSKIIIDFEECRGMDSTFIGILTGFTLKLKKKSMQLNLVNLGKTNRDNLETLGVSRFFEISDAPAVFNLQFESVEDTPEDPEEAISHIKLVLDAHENLMKADPQNIQKFGLVKKTLQKELADKLNEKGEFKKEGFEKENTEN